MHPLHIVRTVAVASVFGAFGALAACGGSSTPASNNGPDAAATNVDAGVDASGNDSSISSGDDGGGADVGPDVPQQDPNTYPAMHHPLPLVDNAGGALLDHMKIVQVTFGTDANVDTYTAFANGIGATMWWQAALMPYGISPAVVSGTVVLPDTVSGTSATDAQVQAYLQQEIVSGALPEPDAETLYVIYAPRTYSVSLPDGASTTWQSCQQFDGYHSSFSFSVPATTDGGTSTGISASYAMVFECYGGLREVEITASHEIAEAATDPHPDQGTTYDMYSDNPWEQVYAGLAPAEVADLCNGEPWSEGTYYYNKIYSNAAAAASKNPCQPDTNVFFAAAIDTSKAVLAPYTSDGFVTVTPGSTTDTVVDFFSQAALPMDATLTVLGYSATDGQFTSSIATGVTATLSQPTAHNGDGLILSMAADSTAVAGNYIFVLRASLSSSNYNDWAAELRVE
jgi:hypothetical protein